MRARAAFALCVALASAPRPAAQAASPDPGDIEQAGLVLRYGIDSEIASLLDSYLSRADYRLAPLLEPIVERSANTVILEKAFSYLGAADSPSGMRRALELLASYDIEDRAAVKAAIAYASKLKGGDSRADALKQLLEIAKGKEGELLYPAIRGVASLGGPDEGKELLERSREAGIAEGLKTELLVAAAELGAPGVLEELSSIIRSRDDESRAMRMGAARALGKLKGEEALAVLAPFASDREALLRYSVIEALGSFGPHPAAVEALGEALRDSVARNRILAAEKLGEIGASAAIPALRYKAEYDPESKMREASLKALARIGGEGYDALRATLLAEKTPEALRRLCFAELASRDPSASFQALDEALRIALDPKKGSRSLYAAYAKSAADSASAVMGPWFAAMLSDSDFSIRIFGIDGIRKAGLISFRGSLERIAGSDKSEAVKKRAKEAIDSLGGSEGADSLGGILD
jgi:HEAT repeat protein